jgi:hypothetical protein
MESAKQRRGRWKFPQEYPAGKWEQLRIPKNKADHDYLLRKKDPLELDPKNTSFVFVTPRRWSQKGQWVKKRRAEEHWADVRCLDSVDLVQWIERFPAVGLWLANLIGKAPAGIRELKTVWVEWSRSTKYPLSGAIVLADRDHEATRILKWLYADPTVMAVQAESPGEAIAVLYAALHQLPNQYRDVYHSRAIVVPNGDIARGLADVTSPLILILEQADPGLSMRLVENGHHVFVASGEMRGVGNIVELRRPTRGSIEHELIRMLENARLPPSGDLAHAGYEQSHATAEECRAEAQKLARDCARSLTILRRLVPAAPGFPTPDWARPENATALLSVLLLGGWDETSPADRAALEAAANAPYDEMIGRLTPLLSGPDSPLRKAGPAWKLASPRDAWYRLAPFITFSDLSRFEKVAIEVLGAADPRFHVQPEKRWLSGLTGQDFQYSELIRTAICETLVLFGAFGHQATSVANASHRSTAIVTALLKDADDHRWWSLSRLLPALAEASPDAFLEAVDVSVERPERPIMALFGEHEGGVFGSEYHSGLLWALETLAWNPDYLSRATELLTKLAALDPGGRYANRPERSLRNIFLLWSPQCSEPLQARLKVLKRLRKVDNVVAWKLMLSLQPAAYESLIPSASPRWRDFPVGPNEQITYYLIGEGAQVIGTWLLEDVGTDEARWIQLIERLNNLSPEVRHNAITRLSEATPNIVPPPARLAIRQTLRKLLHTHRSFRDAEWALPERELEALENVYRALEPGDVIARFAWLFDEQTATQVNGQSHDWERDLADSMKARQRAVALLLEETGIDGVFSLASKVKLPGLVGHAIAVSCADGLIDEVFTRAIDSEAECDWHLAHGIIVSSIQSSGESWGDMVVERAVREKWSAETRIRIFLSLPKTKHFWDSLSMSCPDVEEQYWKRTSIFPISGPAEHLTFALEKLISVGRAHESIHLAGQFAKQIANPLIVRVLREALRSEPSQSRDGNETVMFQYYVEELMGKLDQADDILESEIGLLEWSYLQVLEHSRRPPKVIQKVLAASPEVFTQILSMVYKSSNENVEESVASEDRQKLADMAKQAYSLLNFWTRVPGCVEGAVDSTVLDQWVEKTRFLCDKAGRIKLADMHIGQVFAHAPADPDGTWPCTPVREVIEHVKSRDVEVGLATGVLNKRGITTRNPTDGGALERQEAIKYRAFAKNVRLEWPRTATALEGIARMYEDHAQVHDYQAEQFQW